MMNDTMIRNTPIDKEVVNSVVKASGIKDVSISTIREIVKMVNEIEIITGEKFIRMEMGVPGIAPPQIGVEAEIAALRRGVASKYPMIDGVIDLKNEFKRII